MAGNLPLSGGVEFEIIRDLVARWGEWARGIGSDCATLDVPPGQQLVASTDASVDGVHFRRAWLTAREIGYRAAIAAWSDIAAAAANPLGMLVVLGVPPECRALVSEIGDGIGEAARTVGAPILGGDLTVSTELMLTMTVLGSAARPLTRGGAHVGDRVYVTGTFGGPRKAVEAWSSGRTPADDLRARFARPAARIREAQWLAAHGAAAGVDVSDGVAADLAHVAEASGVRMTIDLDRLPRWPGVSAIEAAGSGEEYELAITAPVAIETTAFAREFSLPLTHIGDVVAGAPGLEVRLAGARIDPIAGYDHFSR
jgi:thiamine-monophosphate kinase